MSLLMQALKKAEHAKQKHSTAQATDSAADKNPPTVPNEEIALSPKEPEITSTDPSNLDMMGLELSPVTPSSSSPQPESTFSEPAFTDPNEASNFDAPRSRQNVDDGNTTQSKRAAYSGDAQLRSEISSNAEALSQQLMAKKRLEQEKATALAAGNLKKEQQKAQTIFASKQVNSNRRTIWIAVIGMLIVALFFGSGYYYLQIAPQNSNSLVKTLPIQAAPAPTVSTAATADTDTTTITEARDATTPLSHSATTTKNTNQLATSRSRQEHLASSKTRAETTVVPRQKTSVSGTDNIAFHKTTVDSQINPALSKAYQFFNSGDLASAQQQYQIVLQQEPNNRDALLGMAAVSLSKKQYVQAGSYYLKLVELDPADPDAIAGIAGLQGGDPADIESRLKRVLTQNPQAGAIQFALGNLYAQQSRWSDAQQAYFRAYSTASTNADYAFNLAVSLDRLNQEKLASEYYQRALAMAQNKTVNFNKSSVQDRINELQSAAAGSN